jgi:hypothetical protein
MSLQHQERGGLSREHPGWLSGNLEQPERLERLQSRGFQEAVDTSHDAAVQLALAKGLAGCIERHQEA